VGQDVSFDSFDVECVVNLLVGRHRSGKLVIPPCPEEVDDQALMGRGEARVQVYHLSRLLDRLVELAPVEVCVRDVGVDNQ
jgi:hypothetical protein